MTMAVSKLRPVTHLPLVLGLLRKLEVLAVIDTLCPPHPDHVVSCGIGVEAFVLAILDGDHALYKVGQRLEERGMLPLLQTGLRRESLNDYRLGHILDAFLLPTSTTCLVLSPSKPSPSTPFPPPGCTRIRRRFGSMGPMKVSQSAARRRQKRMPHRWLHARPMAIAKMADQTSSRYD